MSVDCGRCGHPKWDHGFRNCLRISGIKPCLCEGYKAREEEKPMDQPANCPFCRSDDVVLKRSEYLEARWWVECRKCEARSGRVVDPAYAISAWNACASSSELMNTKRVLEERVEHLSKGLRHIVRIAENPAVARSARLTLEENNEGDVRSPDGETPSQSQAGVG